MNTALDRYENLLIQKRYSQNTQNIYCSYFKDFVDYFRGCDLENITKEQINAYISNLIKTRNISSSQQNQRINAIKFYYEKVIGKTKEYYDLYRPNKENKLPKVLSKNEVKSIFDACSNKA